MSVIPLTLIISLCLVFIFVVFFLREHARAKASSPERDSMLPFADESMNDQEKLVVNFKGKKAPENPYRHVHGVHRHGPDGACENKPDHARCMDCPSRKQQNPR